MKQPQFPLDKFKKIDEYAKSLGITLYTFDCGFIFENKLIHYIINDFNISPDRLKKYPDIIGYFEYLESADKNMPRVD